VRTRVIGTASFTVRKGSAVQIIASAEQQNSTEQTLTEKLGADIRVNGKSTPVGQYTATTVVDLTGQKAELATKIAEALGATVVTTLPSGETATEGAELVVIVANATASVPTP
jgi:erythromycin esterase-like protein